MTKTALITGATAGIGEVAVFYTYLDDLQSWLAQKMKMAAPSSLALPVPAGD